MNKFLITAIIGLAVSFEGVAQAVLQLANMMSLLSDRGERKMAWHVLNNGMRESETRL